jgi:iron complex outermembrane receptor protein
MSQQLLRRSIVAALTGSTAIVAVPLVLAQDQDDAEQLETITVVGSRIKRTDIETSQPVFVLEREDLQRSGLASVGDILQDLATNGATLNTTFNNGGNGETRVSLRNLGSNRTLVLVNGRRWVTGLSGAVDLATLPTSIIERIEVLKDGASAIYGSDAISGVVNITTRSSYDGAEASAYLGENEEGDGRTEQYDFTVGSSTDRASVIFNAAYFKQEDISAGDREISAVPLFGFPGNVASPGRASGLTPLGQFFIAGRPGTQTLIPGRPGTAQTDFRAFNFATDGYNFAPDNYLLTPQERTSVFVQARYNLTDDIAFRSTVVVNERRSSQELAATPLALGAFGSRAIERAIVIPANNVFNPFGVTVGGVGIRPLVELRNFAQDVDTFYFSSGFDGAFDLLDRSFSWDVNYTYTDNENNQSTTGLYDLNRIAAGTGPSFRDAAGVARCGTPTAVIAGCVPLNFFGGPDGFTREMYDYIAFVAQDTFYKKLYNYSANITGDLFELPAGPFAFAAGYEYRREFGFDQPDALIAAGVTSGNSRLPTRGGFSLDEFYAEFNIPIVRDLAFAEIFEIAVAARYSDYSNFGDTTNPKIGFRYKPIADLLIRGNYADGFRAPSVSELFQGASDSFPTVTDPCSQAVFGNQTPDTQSRCRNGIGGIAPVPVGYNQLNAQIRITVGGNPNLDAEEATTKTLGLVYSPSWLEGLDLTLDWYNIELTSDITAFGGTTILNECYQNGDLGFCNLIQRAGSGVVTNIDSRRVNNPSGGTEVEGYDLTVDYRFDTEFGRFRINWDNAYISYYGDVGQNEGDNIIGLYFDRVPVWRLRSNITTIWAHGDWGATFVARYLSDTQENCGSAESTALALQARGFNIPVPCSNPAGSPQWPVAENELDETWYFDLQGTYDTAWNSRITAGVRNLFDEDPPVAFSTFANSFDPQYDVPGRFWYVSYSQKF